MTGPCDIDQLEYLTFTFSHVAYWDETPFNQDPLLAWGQSLTTAPRIRGEVWDATIKSLPAAMDLTLSFDGYDWINYTDNFFFGALYLITGAGVQGSQPSNYAY